jgi:multidrug efflux pump subunit AcrB
VIANFFRIQTRITTLILILICTVGLAGLLTLPRLEDPTLQPRNALIKTFLPGANAERLETEVTEVLEKEIRDLAHIDTLSSESRPGTSIITIKLKDEVTNLDGAWSDLRAELDKTRGSLPQSASVPFLEVNDVRAYALILALTWDTDESELNQVVLQRKAQAVENALYSVTGTEEVKLFGASPEEISVLVDRDQLLGRSLDLSFLRNRLAAQEARTNSGELISQSTRNVLQTDTRFRTLDRIRQSPLVTTPTGGFLPLSSVATVTRGVQNPPPELALVGGRPAIMIAVYAADSQRVDKWTKQVRDRLDALSLPGAIKLQYLLQQTETVQERFHTLGLNLMLAVVAVLVVILMIMGFKASVVVATSIPLTSACVIGGLMVMGIPIHQMSVTGLIVALGLLIDNAIVVTDEMKMETEVGHTPQEAISLIGKRLTLPLTASTATTVLAFLPIAMMPGGGGEFVGSIAISVILAVISSLFLSLTLLPVIYLWISPSAKNTESFWTGSKLVSVYEWLFTHKLVALLLAMLLPLAGFLAAGTLKEQFFPPTDRSQVRMVIELPNSKPIELTREAVLEVRQTLLTFDEVEDAHWMVGRSIPKFYYNLSENHEKEPYFAEALIQLKSSTGTMATIRKLQEALEAKFPGYRPRVIQLEQGPPFQAPVELYLLGPSLETLQQAGDTIRRSLGEDPNVISTRATLSNSLANVEMKVDLPQARKVGLEPQNIADFLALVSLGQTVGTVFEDTETLPVTIRLDNTERSSLSRLSTLTLPTESGEIPLMNLLTWETVPQRAVLAHRHQRRVNTVQGFTEAGVLPSAVLNPLLEKIENGSIDLPSDVTVEVGGEAAERDSAVGNLAIYAIPLVLLMFSSLVVAFRSYRLAFVVGLTGILSAFSGYLTLAVLDIPFGFMAIIGSMGLLGVAVNDSTVVLSALQEGAPEGGVAQVAKVVGGATRHVIATTLTTIAGFLPLLFGADPFWHPLAGVIAGGMLGATVLALLFCPVVYLMTSGRNRKVAAA